MVWIGRSPGRIGVKLKRGPVRARVIGQPALMRPNAEHPMCNENWSMLRMVVAWLMALGGSTTLVATVTAEDATAELSIVATNCERMPIAFPFEGGGCSPASDAVIVVTDSAGSLIGTCITHNRGTIEVAETLYGVSMRENGVSTVLSMRMAGELAS